MKRVELFEFEDFNWLPNVLRNGATSLIVIFHKMMGTAPVVAELILKIKSKVDFDQIVDLGSGSGGAMTEVFEEVQNANPKADLQLLLTDLHPNPKFIEEIEKRNLKNINYSETSTNASNIKEVPKGLKTMVGSFHHMNPTVAKKILNSAEESREPLLIFEVAKNNIPILVWILLLPISLAILIVMSLFMTPFVRPLTFSQLFFTYVIPIIPIIYAWDGQASLMRTYTFKDIEELKGPSTPNKYHWEISDGIKANGKKFGYYIIGYPIG